MKTFSEILVPFLSEKEIQLKKKSLNAYKNQTKVFCEWLNSQGKLDISICDIKEEEVSQFFLYLARDKDLDRPTCQKYYISIKSVFYYAKKRKEITELPFDLVVFPSKKRDCSAQLIPQEAMKLLFEDIKENDYQLFLACMIEYYCFIRPGNEMRNLKPTNFDLKSGTIRIDASIAKNKRARTVTMPTQLIEYCKEYGIDKENSNRYVFGCNRYFDTKPVSENMLRYRFNRFRDKHNISKGVKLYSFKHQGCTTLHQTRLVSTFDLMTQLGHSNLTSTQHYLKKVAGNINSEIRNNFPSPI